MSSPTPPPTKSRHKTALWTAIIIFVLCGIGYWIYWLGWGQYSESTDDAYVNGNMIIISPLQDGIVTTISTDNTQMVEAGQLLVQLDTSYYEIDLDRTKANLADTVRQVVQMFLKVEELEAKKEISKADLTRARLDYDHRRELVSDGSVTREDFEHSETTLAGAYGGLEQVSKELEGARAEVSNTTVPTHPKVEQAKADLRKAFLGLHRCRVLAPTRGIITQRKAQVGQFVRASDSLMALVPADQIWVDANFREVQLQNQRIGQPVRLIAEMYGSNVTYHGEVVGLNPGTGSIFSVIPPQNATGNWIKIIQRIPVKISLNPDEVKIHPLVLGLTMTVYVDTHTRNGLQLPHITPSQPIYSSDVYADELQGSDEMIEQIIHDNI